jgi:hypothetical protein
MKEHTISDRVTPVITAILPTVGVDKDPRDTPGRHHTVKGVNVRGNKRQKWLDKGDGRHP